MKLTARARKIHTQLSQTDVRLAELCKLATEIKKDHSLAMELWSTGQTLCRQLAILIMDRKQLTSEFVDGIAADIQAHEDDDRNQLADWLLANQLSKSKPTIALIEAWETSELPVQRRLFWYYQARLRWTGQKPPDNSEALLAKIEKAIMQEPPEVQWAMNFTAAQIGIFEKAYRKRCVKLGETTGLYRDEKVSRGCTPNYLPEFIAIEAKKRAL